VATVKNMSPLLVIVGETASGKSSLALELAQLFNGEIISGDGRTMYKGMNIGTAKPSKQDQKLVPHHLIDVASLDETMTAAKFKRLALGAIDDIHGRGALPILVGGNGLYIDGVLFDYAFNDVADHALRTELQDSSVEDLQQRLRQANILFPENFHNPRYLIRALETGGHVPAKQPFRANTLVLGIDIERDRLVQNIIDRVQTMLDQGLEGEVSRLVKAYGWNEQLLQTIGYKEFNSYLAGDATIEVVRTDIIRNTKAYAKRQRTWFRRNKSINYIYNQEQSVELVTTWLNKLS
jgi:tRNA dimethylallyltransferase